MARAVLQTTYGTQTPSLYPLQRGFGRVGPIVDNSVTMAATPSAYIPKRKRLTHDANETNDELSSNIVSYDVYIGRWTQDGSVLPSQHPRHVVENL